MFVFVFEIDVHVTADVEESQWQQGALELDFDRNECGDDVKEEDGVDIWEYILWQGPPVYV